MANITTFIDFLQDNYKTELYRNDVKELIKKLFAEKDIGSLVSKYKLDANIVRNKFFLYAFFLTKLDVNILPYLDEEASYNSETLDIRSYMMRDFPPFVVATIQDLKNLVIPGNRHVISNGFLNIEYGSLYIDRITVEEGVEIIDIEAFSGIRGLKEIYLPASLKSFGDVESCPDDIIIYYHPVSKPNGKRGVGFSIKSVRDNKEEWFKSHLKKY